MKPISIGSVRVGDHVCRVFSIHDPETGWAALRAGDVILVRASGSRKADLAIAKSFAAKGT